MILSVSRRSDIPCFHFDWFINRLREGYVLVRNPMNHRQVSRVALTPDTIDCIAFWSKNPAPLLAGQQQLSPYPFFVQFTLNPYDADIEANLPAKTARLDTFRRLSAAIGPQKMFWRYSPILFSTTHTMEYHLHHFEAMAKCLAGHTTRCRISYLDVYRKIAPRMRAMVVRDATSAEKLTLTRQLVDIAASYGIEVGGCGNLDLQAVGLAQTGCIDAEMVSRAIGRPVLPGKDPGQRDACYCMPSVDIGSYNTCPNGCAYCYANHAQAAAVARCQARDVHAPMLCDALDDGDVVTQRKMGPLPPCQMSLFPAGRD